MNTDENYKAAKIEDIVRQAFYPFVFYEYMPIKYYSTVNIDY